MGKQIPINHLFLNYLIKLQGNSFLTGIHFNFSITVILKIWHNVSTVLVNYLC